MKYKNVSYSIFNFYFCIEEKLLKQEKYKKDRMIK